MLAIDQKSRVWQLRATTSLARLWDKRTEARALLAPIYGWFIVTPRPFIEGLESKDLVVASALRDSLR